MPALELTKGSKMVDEGDVKDVLADLSFLKLAATLHRAFYRSGRRVSNWHKKENLSKAIAISNIFMRALKSWKMWKPNQMMEKWTNISTTK